MYAKKVPEGCPESDVWRGRPDLNRGPENSTLRIRVACVFDDDYVYPANKKDNIKKNSRLLM